MNNTAYINDIVRRASAIATEAAMNGNPLAYVQWIPPLSGSSDPRGAFVIKYATPRSASQRPEWTEYL